MQNQTNNNLRPADLIAKVAGVNIKNVVRVLASLELVSRWLDTQPVKLLQDNETAHPTAAQSEACKTEFETLRSWHAENVENIRNI